MGFVSCTSSTMRWRKRPLVGAGDARVRPQQSHGFQLQVEEVERVALPFRRRMAGTGIGEDRLQRCDRLEGRVVVLGPLRQIRDSFPGLPHRAQRRANVRHRDLPILLASALQLDLAGRQQEASAAIAVLAVLDLVMDVGKRSALLDTMVTDIGQIETDCQRLWENVQGDQLSEEDARREHGDLSQRINRVTSRLIIDIDRRLNQRCTEEAYDTAQARYAA